MSDPTANGHDVATDIRNVRAELRGVEAKLTARVDQWDSVLNKSHERTSGDLIKCTAALTEVAHEFRTVRDALVRTNGRLDQVTKQLEVVTRGQKKLFAARPKRRVQ